MYFQLLQFLHPLLLSVLPLAISAWSKRFYKGMTGIKLLIANNDERLRQIRNITLFLLLAHTTCQALTNTRSIGVAACILLTLALCKDRLLHKVILTIQNNAVFYLVAFISLLLALSPTMISFAMALPVLLLASWCYPSQRMIDSVRRIGVQSELIKIHNHPLHIRTAMPKSQLLYRLTYERI